MNRGFDGRDGRTLRSGALVVLLVLVAARGAPSAQAHLIATTSALRATIERDRHDERLARDAARIRSAAASAVAGLVARERTLIPGATPGDAAVALSLLIDRHAATAGVIISSTSVRADSAFGDAYARVSVRAYATADALGLFELLSRIDRSDLLLSILELTVTQPEPAADDVTPESLRIELVVEALARPGTPLPVLR